MIELYDCNKLISALLRSGLLIGAGTVAISIAGCSDDLDDGSAGTAGGPKGSTALPGDSGAPGDWPGGDEPGNWPDSPEDWPKGDGPAGGVPSDWPNPSDPGEASQGGEDLRFSFVLPGQSDLFFARVLGGVDGTTVVIDQAPASYDFELTYGVLPTGFPERLDQQFCSDIEGYVETVESGNTAAPMALEHLRDSYPLANFKVRFGTVFFMQLKSAVRDAASSAGAVKNLRIRNEPTFSDLAFDMVFKENSLTRRMGDHEKAKTEFRDQFLANASSSIIGVGEYPGGSSWPDLLCDLYTKRA